MGKVYHCVVCQRAIVGKPVEHEDGETSYIFVHDDVNHPEGMTFDEESKPQ